jgi:FkbM family methyltransferase
MRGPADSLYKAVLRLTGLGLLPVRVRGGVAEGARWTLYPWTSYWRGTHEPEFQAALLALGNGDIRGWSCWDLGAHFGLYSVGLARRVGPTGQVAAFEPNPVSCTRLRRHAAMNRVPWLKIYEAAVSNRAGTDEFYTYGDLGSTITHLAYEGETRSESCEIIPVKVVCLDALVDAGELRPPRFVKIDVEGHGHKALEGMLRTVRSHLPVIAVAFHSSVEIGGVAPRLASLGYVCRRIGSDAETSDPVAGADYLFTPPR